MTQDRYLPLDEDGYFWFDGAKLEDPEIGGELIRNLTINEKGRLSTTLRGQDAIIEAFDAPLVARHVSKPSAGSGRLDLPYGVTATFDFKTLRLDEWDRFHGTTDDNVPFVFSRTAQFEFFDLLGDFDDDSITVDGQRIEIPPWLPPNATGDREEFWNTLYRGTDMRWDLDKEAPALAAVLPQLKLTRQRILVLGSGVGHDAAYFARLGHSVTAVDFSFDAIERARGTYPGIEGLRFVRADAFRLPPEFNGRYDIVFEHTMYCAIDPKRRNELVKVWTRALQPRGHLLGIFYVNDRVGGPPFGGSEWEIRQRLRASFHSIFWTRWRHSVDSRKGRELVVYANRLNDSP